MTAQAAPARLVRPDGTTIAYHALSGKPPVVMFCGGFKSDMTGTKALALEASCRAEGRGFIRFDYYAHGASPGDFEQATIGRWKDDTLAVIDEVVQDPLVVVGSSMGGWMMLLAALARPERVKGLVGVAAAPDFTQELMWPELSDEARAVLARDGVWRRPSQYSDDPYPITLRLIEEGRDHLVLNRLGGLACPVRLLHGVQDADVPWRHSLRLLEALGGVDVTLTLVKDGDHRLSTPADIARLCTTVEALCRQVGQG
ncbi:alpha/beta hydrolase family protein [Desertibaculum subflavum]|uniref:alpha/beta hydrolase family protein n=1 Tax=Desertibaculum subflavum TaxID=2268458 RepID=UPI0034D37F76